MWNLSDASPQALMPELRREVDTLKQQLMVVAAQTEPPWELVSERMTSEVERVLEGQIPPSPEVSDGRVPISLDAAQTASEEISRLGDDLARVTAHNVADTRKFMRSSVQEGTQWKS